MILKHILPTQHIGQITVELEFYNEQTGYSLFSIEFDAFIKVKIKLTGDTIESISEIVKKILIERGLTT